MAKRRVDDIEPAPTVEFKRAPQQGKATRVMSASMIAAMLCVRREVILTWKRDGCPCEREATKKGESDSFDIADVIAWRLAVIEARAIGLASEAAGMAPVPGLAPDGKETKEQADTRRARALANMAEIEEAQAANAVVPIAAIEDIVRKEYGDVRASLENIGSSLADRTSQITDPARIKKIADELIRKALEKLVGRVPGADGLDEDPA